MSNTQVGGENSFVREAKYKLFSGAVEKALKSFEGPTEWQDLISCLARINKVLLAYMQYPVIPLQLTVCKRLTQCLHPNLPFGVHLTTLDVYEAIFDRIGPHGLLSNFQIYSNGLFPLLSHSSMSVRPRLLGIYEKYFLVLGKELVPTLHGFVLGLLPGLEDESEHSDRICGLLNALSQATDESSFFHALWQCILGSPSYRVPSTNFLLAKLNKKMSAEDQVHCMGGCLPLVVSSICVALLDKNVLVQRTTLDIITILFPFHLPFLLSADLIVILTTALETLLRRDASLSRRFYCWLLGPSKLNRPSSTATNRRLSSTSSVVTSSKPVSAATGSLSDSKLSLRLTNTNQTLEYFEKHSKVYLMRALRHIIACASGVVRGGALRGHVSTSVTTASKAECVLPYRLLKSLVERPEIRCVVMDGIMLDLASCLQAQIDSLGGLTSMGIGGGELYAPHSLNINIFPRSEAPQKLSRKGSLKVEVVQSANLFFASLGQDFVWEWMEGLLEKQSVILVSAVGVSRTLESPVEGRDECGGEEYGRQRVVVLEKDVREEDEDSGVVLDTLSHSPISDILDSDLLTVRMKKGKSGRDLSIQQLHTTSSPSSSSKKSKPLDLTAVLSLVMFLLQVLPKDSVPGVHEFRLLLRLVSLLRSHEPFLTLRELSHGLTLSVQLMHDCFLRTSSSFSVTSTPSTTPTITPSTPPSTLGHCLTSAASDGLTSSPIPVLPSPSLEFKLLSSDEMKLEICNEYTTFFSEFVDHQVNSCLQHHRGSIKELSLVFSSSCQALMLLAKSQIIIHSMKETVSNGTEEKGRPPKSQLPAWLANLMQACLCDGRYAGGEDSLVGDGGGGTVGGREGAGSVRGRGGDGGGGASSVGCGVGAGGMRGEQCDDGSDICAERGGSVDGCGAGVGRESGHCDGSVGNGSGRGVRSRKGDGVGVCLVSLKTLLSLVEIVVTSQTDQGGLPQHSSRSAVLAPASAPLLVVTSSMAQSMILSQRFVKLETEFLWGLLSTDHPSLHPQVGPLLSWLHSLCVQHNACEEFILEQFAIQDLDAYQKFSILWHYIPAKNHTVRIKKPFHRAILRMLEGLLSANSAVRELTQSWVKTAIAGCSKEGALVEMIQPLVMILLKPGSLRRLKAERLSPKKIALSREDADRDERYARYYFESLGVKNPYAPSVKEQYTDILLQATQLLDAAQLLYAIFLLQSVVSVSPQMLVSAAGNVMVDMSAYASSVGGTNANVNGFPGRNLQHAPDYNRLQSDCGSSASVCETASPISPNVTLQKSLLELLLSVCSDLLRSEYHPTLDVTVDDQVAILEVKTSCACLLSTILNELLKILVERESASAADSHAPHIGVSVLSAPADFKVFSPYFVSALVALCDVQLVALLLLGKSVEWWREAFLPSASPLNGGSETKRKGNMKWDVLSSGCDHSGGEGQYGHQLSIIMHSLYTQMLKVVQCLIALDAQFSLSLPPGTNQHPVSHPPNSVSILSGVRISRALSPTCSADFQSSSLPAILPSCPTASQPFFRDFLLLVLLDPSLSLFHDNLLLMFLGTISNLLRHQLLELAPKVIKQLCVNVEEVMNPPHTKDKKHHHRSVDTESSSANYHFCVVYLKSLLDTILWCLFGKTFGADLAAQRTNQSKKSSFNMHYRLPHPLLFSIIQVLQVDNGKEDHSPTLKQTSTMSWLLGVFSSSHKMGVGGGIGGLGEGGGEKGSGDGGDGGVRSLHGVDSLVLQHILLLLPCVYNTMADVWTNLHSGGDVRVDQDGGGSDVRADGDGGMRCTAMDAVGDSVLGKDNLVLEDVEWLFGEFLCSLAELKPILFFSSISHIWLEWSTNNKTYCGIGGGGRGVESKGVYQKKESFIDILHHIKVLPLGVMLQCLHSTLIDIAHGEEYELGLLHQTYLLHFLYKYISSMHQSSKELSESRAFFVSFLRDYHQHIYNSAAQLLGKSCHIYCMLISILHVVVCRIAPPNPKTQKKERRDLQELSYKLCETLSMVAKISITDEADVSHANGSRVTTEDTLPDEVNNELPSALSGSLALLDGEGSDRDKSNSAHVKEKGRSKEESGGERRHLRAEKPSRNQKETPSPVELFQPAVQALAVLSNVLAHFIDCVFESSEKDKVTCLLKAVLLNVWPHLHNHSQAFQQCYAHSSKLLASLSGFQVTRKSWKKEAFDLFLAPDFFVTNMPSLLEWKVIVDNLVTQDQVTFRDLLNRLHSMSVKGIGSMFSSPDQEISSGSILLKRMAFTLLSGEVDQYVKYLPDIQENLSEYLRVQRYPSICCEVLLTFRVLLVKFSPHHLLAFWPAITAELFSLLSQLEVDVKSVVADTASKSAVPRQKLQLYLSACKLLDTALALPPTYLPHFQWLQWGFMATESEEFVVTRLCKHFRIIRCMRELELPEVGTPPYLRSASLSSLSDLSPFFATLMFAQTSDGSNGHQSSGLSSTLWLSHVKGSTVAAVEDVIVQDFLESST